MAEPSPWLGLRFAEPGLSTIRLSSSLEGNVMILAVYRPGFQSVANQAGYQPAKGNVLLLGGLP
jgi:hypothetical protein